MANENAKSDANWKNTLLAVSNDANAETRRILVDPVTGRLLVDTTGTLTGTQYTEGDVDASITGNAMMWEDTDNTLSAVNINKPFPVQIMDGAGGQITSFGGGTQYDEGDTAATITGTALMWEDTDNTLRSISASKPLPVNVVSGDMDIASAIPAGTNLIGKVDIDPTETSTTVTVNNGSSSGESSGIGVNKLIHMIVFKIPDITSTTAELKLLDSDDVELFTSGELAENTNHTLIVQRPIVSTDTWKVETSSNEGAQRTFTVLIR